MKLIELLCVMTLIAVLAIIDAGPAARAIVHVRCQMSLLFNFHNGRIEGALNAERGPTYDADIGLADGSFAYFWKLP